MSLALLVAMVVAGVSGVVLLVHLTGGGKPARLADEAAALARFALDFPDFDVRSVHLTREGDAAFLALGDGPMGARVGIVQAVGGKFLTRVIAGRDLAGAPRAANATLMLRLGDFTWPGGMFTFAGPDEARAVEGLLLALRGRT